MARTASVEQEDDFIWVHSKYSNDRDVVIKQRSSGVSFGWMLWKGARYCQSRRGGEKGWEIAENGVGGDCLYPLVCTLNFNEAVKGLLIESVLDWWCILGSANLEISIFKESALVTVPAICHLNMRSSTSFCILLWEMNESACDGRQVNIFSDFAGICLSHRLRRTLSSRVPASPTQSSSTNNRGLTTLGLPLAHGGGVAGMFIVQSIAR